MPAFHPRPPRPPFLPSFSGQKPRSLPGCLASPSGTRPQGTPFRAVGTGMAGPPLYLCVPWGLLCVLPGVFFFFHCCEISLRRLQPPCEDVCSQESVT